MYKAIKDWEDYWNAVEIVSKDYSLVHIRKEDLLDAVREMIDDMKELSSEKNNGQ